MLTMQCLSSTKGSSPYASVSDTSQAPSGSLFRTLGIRRALTATASTEVLRRTYGKDNRVLHTGKLSQSFKVVAPSRTWQGAGISAGSTKIGVTGPETRMAKLKIEQGEAMTRAISRFAE